MSRGLLLRIYYLTVFLKCGSSEKNCFTQSSLGGGLVIFKILLLDFICSRKIPQQKIYSERADQRGPLWRVWKVDPNSRQVPFFFSSPRRSSLKIDDSTIFCFFFLLLIFSLTLSEYINIQYGWICIQKLFARICDRIFSACFCCLVALPHWFRRTRRGLGHAYLTVHTRGVAKLGSLEGSGCEFNPGILHAGNAILSLFEPGKRVIDLHISMSALDPIHSNGLYRYKLVLALRTWDAIARAHRSVCWIL